MRGDNSLMGRLAEVPRKIRERGLGWVFRRFAQVVSERGVLGARAVVWTLLRSIPYIRSITRDTFAVVYDLNVYPISYDVCWLLVWADLDRRQRQLARMHCIFLPIDDHSMRTFPVGYDAVVDRTSRAWRFQNVCLAAVSLVPACTGVTVGNTRAQASVIGLMLKRSMSESVAGLRSSPLSVIYRDLMARVAAATGDWGLKAPGQGLRYVDQWIRHNARGRKLVVVTLRQYAVDAERNSRVDDWLAFLRDLDQNRYFPVIVPDTDHALEEQGGFGGIAVFNEAAWNLGLRAALYERAYINMFVNSGPASLCILNPRTCYLLFKITVPGIHLASEETLREMGFEPNTQPPIATTRQRWVWEDDRRDVIEREFASMVEHLEITSNAAPPSAAAN